MPGRRNSVCGRYSILPVQPDHALPSGSPARTHQVQEGRVAPCLVPLEALSDWTRANVVLMP